MKLLIVEDHPSSRKLLRVQLEAEGHTVTEAANGLEALEILGSDSVDGVVSDILMPGMDGFRLCHELRRRGTQIPLVIYTGTFSSESDQQLAQTLGAGAFIRKPASTATILAALREARERVARGQEGQAAGPGTDMLEPYNRALARKLEDRNQALQQSLAQIHRAHEEIIELNHTLETRVVQRTTASDAANADLEMTARAVALELAPPLQVIKDKVDQLEQLAAEDTEEQRRSCIENIRSALHRVGQLVDVLSDFTRLATAPATRTRFELEPLVDEAIATVRVETVGRSIQWQRQSLPSTHGDPALLRQVLVCLIGNAVRYTRGRDPAIIEIGHREGRASELVVFVRDNGLGYDLPPDEPGETHLGLMSIRRIIGRHGGRVWSDTAIGCGTTIYFSLPHQEGNC
jgi:CheY-like chemotaxis protein